MCEKLTTWLWISISILVNRILSSSFISFFFFNSILFSIFGVFAMFKLGFHQGHHLISFVLLKFAWSDFICSLSILCSFYDTGEHESVVCRCWFRGEKKLKNICFDRMTVGLGYYHYLSNIFSLTTDANKLSVTGIAILLLCWMLILWSEKDPFFAVAAAAASSIIQRTRATDIRFLFEFIYFKIKCNLGNILHNQTNLINFIQISNDLSSREKRNGADEWHTQNGLCFVNGMREKQMRKSKLGR